MKTTIKIKIRGYHVDFNNHVHHARYLEFLEEGRWHFFEEAEKIASYKSELKPVIASLSINYKREVKLGDVIEISTQIYAVAQKLITIKQEIHNCATKKLVSEAEIKFALLIPNKTFAAVIDDYSREKLEKLISA